MLILLPLANVLTYFGQSNGAGKVIVLLLVVFSFTAWTVMIGKYLELRRMRMANKLFDERMRATPSVIRVDPEFSSTRGPFAALSREALATYHRSENSAHSISHVENSLQRAVSRVTLRYESRMVMLSSIVTGAPFLGLLGTVWGVMDAFGSISTASGASVGTLAPGVSGALLTTVAGLVVAIPSVFGYNFLLTQTKLMVIEAENFASDLADRIEIETKEL
jgi:biopolymer transport protein TolQ|tara:strand:- start:226 stop:888 length:663 start_codon:yes stop_codon:yes gene_type:complete